MTNTDVIAEAGLPQIRVRREFPVARRLLFRAMTDPDLIPRWLGPANLTTIVDVLEFRHGGQWRYTHHDSVGNTYSFRGVYHGDPSEDLIVQTYEFESDPGAVCLNTLALEPSDVGSILTQNTVFQSVEHRDNYLRSGAAVSVSHSFDRLESVALSLG